MILWLFKSYKIVSKKKQFDLFLTSILKFYLIIDVEWMIWSGFLLIIDDGDCDNPILFQKQCNAQMSNTTKTIWNQLN